MYLPKEEIPVEPATWQGMKLCSMAAAVCRSSLLARGRFSKQDSQDCKSLECMGIFGRRHREAQCLLPSRLLTAGSDCRQARLAVDALHRQCRQFIKSRDCRHHPRSRRIGSHTWTLNSCRHAGAKALELSWQQSTCG